MYRRRPTLVAAAPALAFALAAILAVAVVAPAGATAGEEPVAGAAEAPCGPQAPRDIGRAGGTNTLPVPGDDTPPPRLCNVHFHRPAEHQGIGACPVVAANGTPGAVCGGVGHEPVRPGEEIEVHWVHTSCPAPEQMQQGLGNCVCGGDREMELMVLAQKYVVAAAGDATAVRELREPASDLARFAGSTTGPGFSAGAPGDDRACSPVRVQWAVARRCEPLSLTTLGDWCASNEWGEDHAHGVRGLVEREDWLAPYTPGGN